MFLAHEPLNSRTKVKLKSYQLVTLRSFPRTFPCLSSALSVRRQCTLSLAGSHLCGACSVVYPDNCPDVASMKITRRSQKQQLTSLNQRRESVMLNLFKKPSRLTKITSPRTS